MTEKEQKNEDLLHYGRIGMKWYQNIYGSKNKSDGGRRSAKEKAKSEAAVRNHHISLVKKYHKNGGSVNEFEREASFIKEYKHRDKMSTKAIKARTDRLRAENDFKEQVYRQHNQRIKEAQEAARVKKMKAARRTKIALSIVSNLPLEEFIPAPNPSRFGLPNPKSGVAVDKNSKEYKAFEKALADANMARKLTKIFRDGAKGYANMINPQEKK